MELHKLEKSCLILSQFSAFNEDCCCQMSQNVLQINSSLLKPNLADKVENKQLQQKVDHGHVARLRSFKEDETVYVRNFGPGQKWLPGTIVATTGPSVLSCPVGGWSCLEETPG